jgi:PPM family protein phosphatase
MSAYLRPLYAARTDPGRQRDHNEDAVRAAQLLVAGDKVSPWYVFAVADGVGGHERGEWASQTAIAVVNVELAKQLTHSSPVDALRTAFEAANAAVLGGGTSARPDQHAATTLVAALVREGTLWWAHVGDSRAYLVRQGRAKRLTQDHSWVDEQVRAGFMSREDALLSDRRHAITRSIGFEATVNVDASGPIPLRSGDVLILCSDGLHGQVADEEMAGVVQQLLPEAATERLVALSNLRGGPDNISVVVCVMFDASAGDPAGRPRPMEPDVTPA